MPVEAIAGKLTGDQGEVIAVVTILHDRTEAIENARLYAQLKEASGELERKVRQATAELVRQNELLQRQAFELEQASNLKSQFLANVSHEFRTPLNAILGYTSMLLQGVSGEVPERCMKQLQRVDSNARHLLAIINDILDIARIESGRMPLNVGEFALAELVGEVLAELEPIIQRSHIEVDCDPAETVPQMRTDRQKVKQIVLNLLSNALKFTHDGSIRVGVSHEATTDRILVAVTDTGIGIDPRHHEKIFEDFQQADNSTTRQYGGTGLGLSICRRLARMLGGDISLASGLGKGSTFTLTIPRRLRKK
jgi:signal transduction histidine kinase